MSAFNRGFVSVLAILWCAVLGGLMYLVWYQARMVDMSNSIFKLNFDVIADTRSEQILGTIILGALMLPAIVLLLMELMPHRRRAEAPEVVREREVVRAQDRERYSQLEARIESLQRRLDEEHKAQSRPETPVYEGQPSRSREHERRGWRFLPSRR